MRHRQIWFGPVHYFGDRASDTQWIGNRTHNKIGRPSSKEISIVGWRVIESILVHISGDANDHVPAGVGIERAEIEALSKCVAIREKPLCQRFVDDRAL
jgi:hypothetical protein